METIKNIIFKVCIWIIILTLPLLMIFSWLFVLPLYILNILKEYFIDWYNMVVWITLWFIDIFIEWIERK